MKQRLVTIKHKNGLHARPAANFVQAAQKFKCEVKLKKDGFTVNGKSIMGVLTLGADFNSKVLLIVNGEDEDKALSVLSKILEYGE
jgi:phosphotransferase system HPr (HPr) family protein